MKKIVTILIAMCWLSSYPGFYSILPGMREAYADGWYNTSWSSRKKITIDNTKVTADLTDFPVLISLTSDTGLAADAQDDGDDILFTSSDGTTKLSHEIEKFDGSTGELVAWVKVPTLADITDTVLYMYYKNSAATSQQDATNVWGSNYKMVWHLKESGNGTASEFADSTSTAVHGQGGGGTASAVPTRVTGKIGYGQSSDGTNDYIKIPDNGDFTLTTTNDYTWSTWIKNAAFTEWSTVWSQTIDTNRFFYYYAHTTTDATAGPVTAGVTVYWQSSAGNQLVAHTSNSVLDTTSFHYVVLTYDSSQAQASRFKIYVDGTDVTATGDIASAGTIASINPTNIRMTSNEPFGEYYNGVADEQCFSNTVRASTWIQTEYNNQSSPSTFYTLGAAESLAVTPPEPQPRVTLSINSTSPSDGDTDVAIDTTVSATFSMLMNGSTLTTDTFKLNDGNNKVAGSVTTNGATATFTPAANLAYNTEYMATITTGAQAANYAGTTLDNDYSWNFTTADDAEPPTVLSTSPANGAAAVAFNSTISATFSEAVRASTIGTATFTIQNGTSDISGTVSYSGTTATFKPSSNLSAFTTYTATITVGVKDTTGNAMASDYTWSFTTVDTIQPTVISTSPADGDTGVSLDSTITATFSETMDASTITTDTFTISSNKGRINGTISYKGRTATFTPSSNLSDSTTYTATITPGTKDLAGNMIASDYTWSFTTLDTTKPTVLSTSPANDATGVSLDTTVSAIFSETMDTTAITANTFIVSTNGSRISGAVSYNGTTAVFTPSGDLSESTTYTATITTGARDTAGNAIATDYTWNFTTGDFSRPTVTSTSPVNTATDVALSSVITATFNESMDASTINTNTLTVSTGNKKVTGTVSYSNATATFIPSRNLSDSTTYTATITTGARDASGNALASNYSWSFTTVDITPPKVVSTNPVKNAAGVALNSIITATFNEVTDASTITTDTFTVNNGSSNISGKVSYSGMTATFAPSGNLLNSTVYKATITTGVEDVAGNAIASNYTWSFTTTGDDVPPTVISTSPANGASDIALNSIISATFSEIMGTSTITTDTFTVSSGGSNVDGKVEYSNKTAIFTPSNNLSPFTTYTAKISTGAVDAAGNAMASDYTWSFVTSTEVDGTSPTITSTSPSNGAADADITGTINATFSEAMNVFTINTDTFIMSTSNSTVSGHVDYSNKLATFTPVYNLSPYTTYTARITTGTLDVASNAMVSDYTWSFTTTGDFAPPTVISTSPANGDAGVDLNSAITATFSERMDASSINTNTFIVNDGVNNINGTVTYNSETMSATVTLPDKLFPFTTYTASTLCVNNSWTLSPL